MKKKTKKKIIELIVKTSLIVPFIFLIIAIMLIFFNDRSVKSYFDLCGGLFFITGIVAIFLTCKFPYVLERPKVKAYEFPLKISNFDAFMHHLDKNMSIIGYRKFDSFKGENELVSIYYKQTHDILEYYCIYHFDELKDTKVKTLDYCSKLTKQFFKLYYKNQHKNDFLRETLVIWVDKESKTFKDIVNINLYQGRFDGIFIAGLSPSNQTIYVANQKDGDNVFLYLELRRNFLDIMHLKMNDKIKKINR